MVWVTITGVGVTSATRFKGDALNKIDDMLSGVDVTDTVKIHKNVTWSFIDDAFRIKNPADTFSYIFTPSAIIANRILTIPLMTADEEIVTTQASQAVIKNKDLEDTTELVNAADVEKKVGFSLSGITTTFKTTLAFINTVDRTITFPNATDTLMGKATSDIMTFKSYDANGTGNVLTNVGDAEMEIHTTTKISTLSKALLNAQLVYIDQTNAFGDFAQLFKDNILQINNPADTFKYTITAGAIAEDRILNIPVTLATDTLAVLGLGQTFTGLNSILVSSSGLTVRNPADTFKYTITAGAILADRILNIPVITGTDTIDVLGLAQTFTAAKTFNNGTLLINNPAATFAYTITPAAIAAARILNLPLITGTDTLAALGMIQTFTAVQTMTGLNAILMAQGGLTIRNPANTFAYTLQSAAIVAARQLTLPLTTQTETLAVVPQTAQSTPADPTGTTSLTGVMMGLAGAITPRVTGKLLILISGDIDNDTITDGVQIQLRYGTGAAPTNGAALTGTVAGGLVKFTLASAAQKAPAAAQAIVSGLTVGTAYWIDIGLAAITAGTASMNDISLTIFEL
jgi:hypothetical protein